MPLLKTMPTSLALKAHASGKGEISGYASLYDVEDHEADMVAPGAFEASLAEWQKAGRTPPLLWQHDAAQPIGVWRFLKSDARGLYVTGQLFIEHVARAAEAYALVKGGALTGLSIGYKPERVRRDSQRGLRVLERIRLYEISLVTFPALEAARVSEVKALQPGAALVEEMQQMIVWLQAATPVSASTLSNHE